MAELKTINKMNYKKKKVSLILERKDMSLAKPLFHFGPWPIGSSEVFFTSRLSYGLVNLKPVVPGRNTTLLVLVVGYTLKCTVHTNI